ncbi:MAG: hypothetical protein RL300_277 [Pseudomonadota bacterium]
MKLSRQMNRRFVLGAAAAAMTAGFLPTVASAQGAWPSRPIKLIDAFTPGGSSDMIARAIGAKLAARLGQPVIVENKAGAGGALGTDAVAKAPADGYTLLLTTTGMPTNSALSKKLPFDLTKDLIPIGQIAATTLVIVVPVNSPIKTLKDMVDMARAKPNSITYGSSGVGSMSHIGMELLASEAKVKMLHVPYKGTSLATTDLMGGQLHALLGTFATYSQLLESGKLRALVVASPHRLAFAPNVPTAAESGLPGFQIDFSWGIMGPAGMPANVVKRLNEEVNLAVTQPDMRELLARVAAVPTPGAPEVYGKQMVFEVNRWSKVIQDANIKVE